MTVHNLMLDGPRGESLIDRSMRSLVREKKSLSEDVIRELRRE